LICKYLSSLICQKRTFDNLEISVVLQMSRKTPSKFTTCPSKFSTRGQGTLVESCVLLLENQMSENRPFLHSFDENDIYLDMRMIFKNLVGALDEVLGSCVAAIESSI
jgi:hypothetical protein